MKIRNGFVSNSSSSSFIISYDKTKIITNPYDLIDELRENNGSEYLMVGPYLNEGRDVFELNDLTKDLIKAYPESFVESMKKNSRWEEEYKNEEEPFNTPFVVIKDNFRVTDGELIEDKGEVAYLEDLCNKTFGYKRDEDSKLIVKSSDIDIAEAKKTYEEEKELAKQRATQERIKNLKDAWVKNAGVNEIYIDYRSVFHNGREYDRYSIEDFLFKYLGITTPDDEYEDEPPVMLLKKKSFFVMSYEESNENIENILEMVSSPNYELGSIVITLSHPATSVLNEDGSINGIFFQIGEKEKRLLVKYKKDILENKCYIKAYKGVSIIEKDRRGEMVLNGIDLTDKKTLIRYGKTVFLESGSNCSLLEREIAENF